MGVYTCHFFKFTYIIFKNMPKFIFPFFWDSWFITKYWYMVGFI